MDLWLQRKLLLLLLPFLLLLLLLLRPASCWRREEFRNCDQTPFCKQARASVAGSSDYTVSDVSIVDGRVQATLYPSIHPKVEANDGEVKETKLHTPLLLELTVYSDGILRIQIDEKHSEEGKQRRRFRVPDVIETSLDDKKLWLQNVVEKKGEGGESIFFLASGVEVHIRHSPFEVYVFENA